MANKYSSHLFELIKSLTKAEKRYFTLFVARHTSAGPNNAQILFEEIEGMEDYQEEILLEKLKDHAFTNKFSITKARLYDTILKSLDAFYAEKSKEQLIRNEIHYVEILFNKSLYKQCQKRIISAKKQAKKYNKTHLFAELILWEKKLIEKDNYQTISLKAIEKLTNTEQETLSYVSTNSKLWEFKAILFRHLNTIGRARSSEEVAQLKSEIDSKLKALHIPEGKIRLNYLYNHIVSAYHFAIYEDEASLKSVLKNVALIEKNPNEFGEEPNILISALTNGVYLAMKNYEVSNAQALYNKLKLVYSAAKEEGSNDVVLKVKSSLISLELLLIKLTCNFGKFEKLSPDIYLFIKENKRNLTASRLAFLYYNIAHILFIQDQFNEALKWINSLLNDIDIDQSQEVYSAAEILNLFIHFELENKELVRYTLKSTKRFLKTRNKLFDYENLVLNFMQKTTNYNFDQYEYEEVLEGFISDLKKVTSNPFENIPFEYFDCLIWAESKLKNQKLSTLTVEKNEAFLSFSI